MFAAIEINNSGVIVHETFDSIEAAENAVKNVKRRVAVTGEVFAAAMFDEEVVESDFAASEYVSFADAARFVGVRYQQVFQRAVVKGKMSWRQVPENQVLFADAVAWKDKRAR
jgi:hypothetical protein